MKSVSRSDFVARNGGDEFYALCPGADGNAVKRIISKVNRNLSKYNSRRNLKALLNIYITAKSINEDYQGLFDYIGKTMKSQKNRQ